MLSKRQIVLDMFEELAIAGYEFDLDAEELQSALRSLEGMMALWSRMGINVGYQIASNPDLDDESGLPDTAREAVVLNLALRKAASQGKAVPKSTATFAKQAMNTLMIEAASPPKLNYAANMPRGAGAKTYRVGSRPFFPRTTQPLTATPNGEAIDFD